MIVGTRVVGARSAGGGMASTVSQSRRIARPSITLAPERGDRELPPMSPPRRASRVGRGRATATLSWPALLGAAAAGLRRPTPAAFAGGPGPGGSRRQPHGADVHRGPDGGLALRRAPPPGGLT